MFHPTCSVAGNLLAGKVHGYACLSLAAVLACAADLPALLAESLEPSFQDLLAVSRPAVADRLRLSTAQREQIGRLVSSFQSGLPGIGRGYPPGAQDMEGLQIRKRLLAQLGNSRKETTAKISAVLSAEQRTLLARLGPGRAEEKLPPSDISIEEGRFRSEDKPPLATKAQLALKVEYSKARLTDTATGKPVGSPLYHGEERLITCHAFSPDGKLVATGTGKISSTWTRGNESGDEGEVRVWDTTTGKLLSRKSLRYYVTDVTFLPDGKSVRVETEPVNGR
jgi:hypothetical protein